MKSDPFEQQLRRQPLRDVPPEWRETILSAARQAAESPRPPRPTSNVSAWRLLFSTLNSQLSTLLWPAPRAWGGLAAVWLAIAGMNLATRDTAARISGSDPLPSHQLLLSLKEQERLLAELIGPHEAPPETKSKPAAPGPRSQSAPLTGSV